jgi:hypothetical protein
LRYVSAAEAGRLLREGKVGLVPTETVVGQRGSLGSRGPLEWTGKALARFEEPNWRRANATDESGVAGMTQTAPLQELRPKSNACGQRLYSLCLWQRGAHSLARTEIEPDPWQRAELGIACEMAAWLA